MDIFKKAYECTFNEWHEVDSLGVTRHFETDWISSSHVYANSPSQAKYNYLLDMGWEDKKYIDVKVRRAKYLDLMVQVPHELTTQLTPEQKRKMFHAIGYDDRRIENTFYRNYFQCEYDADLDSCVSGLIEKSTTTTGLPFYYLTDLGLEVIKSLTPKKRCHLTSLNLI